MWLFKLEVPEILSSSHNSVVLLPVLLFCCVDQHRVRLPWWVVPVKIYYVSGWNNIKNIKLYTSIIPNTNRYSIKTWEKLQVFVCFSCSFSALVFSPSLHYSRLSFFVFCFKSSELSINMSFITHHFIWEQLKRIGKNEVEWEGRNQKHQMIGMHKLV